MLSRVLIYCKSQSKMAEFYVRHFDFVVITDAEDQIVELASKKGGAHIMLHAAAKSQKTGQSGMKLVFQVEDVGQFISEARSRGLTFGPVHQADGYQFSNAKDPEGNSISVSTRPLR